MLRRSVRNLLSDGSSLSRPFETGFATVFIFGFSRTELAEFVDKSYLRFLQRYVRLAGYGSDEDQNVPLPLSHPSLAVVVPFRTVRNVLAYSESVCEEARFEIIPDPFQQLELEIRLVITAKLLGFSDHFLIMCADRKESILFKQDMH